MGKEILGKQEFVKGDFGTRGFREKGILGKLLFLGKCDIGIHL